MSLAVDTHGPDEVILQVVQSLDSGLQTKTKEKNSNVTHELGFDDMEVGNGVGPPSQMADGFLRQEVQEEVRQDEGTLVAKENETRADTAALGEDSPFFMFEQVAVNIGGEVRARKLLQKKREKEAKNMLDSAEGSSMGRNELRKKRKSRLSPEEKGVIDELLKIADDV